jgi:hypothetical protein
MNQEIYIQKNDIHATLCTWLYCGFHMMYNAERKGLRPYISWPTGKFLQSYEDKERFAVTPNAYDWYFVQPFVKEPPLENTIWTWELEKWGANVDTTDFQLISEPLSVIRNYYQKHLHFNEETNRRGQLLVNRYGIDFKRTIGLSWRGTDTYLDGRPRLSIGTYFPFIDDILTQDPDLRIACTAEEETILDPLLARYPNSFKIEEFVSSPFQSKHNPERISKMSGYERGLQPALMVWLFSKCAHYIKNRSSTGAVASWLSNGRIVNLGHGENLGFPANNDFAEIEGQRYPLYR